MQSKSENSEHYLDDLYIYDTALTEAQVKLAYDAATGTTTLDPESCGEYHATTKIGSADVDIAQIKKGLANNPYDSQRAGWYYVNSHSTWADIEGCLESGKQYIGIKNESGIDLNDKSMRKNHATVPRAADSELQGSISAGDTDDVKYNPPDTERSIRFYVDTQNHLRCFVWNGDDTKDVEKNARTFCSLVYEKKDKQLTKYEALNGALNNFYQDLAKYSDLSNTALVRFSTHNLAKDLKDEDKINKRLQSLIMKDWTNYSDAYTNSKITDRANYLQDLLDAKGRTSASATESSARPDLLEYPYAMTGGTYTWTGLKAFYDNMVKTEPGDTGKVYDIANDARDKYLIIFTDGRDNTQDYNLKEDGTPDYSTGSGFTKKDFVNVENYNPYYNDDNSKNEDEKHKVGVDDHTIAHDGDLAEAWADKLKDEGYTIYCVMLATGSISPSTNEGEYNRAYSFLKTLAGANEGKDRDLTSSTVDSKTLNKYILSVNNDSDALNSAFEEILENIKQPRDDYTVQDYIDPRFDLVDAGGNLYQLGANGNITVKNADGTTTDRTVENVIEKINETPTMTADECKALGLAYTPRESHMVNRKADPESEDGYDKGDGVGTGYLYYDDVKDMYYLRWTDQIIPMESESFDTDEDKDEHNEPKKLNIWSATIRLKAKDDFIGGNNILTNGNEAGENLVYSDATIKNMDKGENWKLYGLKEGYTYRDKLEALSGTNRKINAVDADGVSQAVYGDGIDIPSSGFPRTTVNVRLLKLNAKNLNDVIYMGEVVSPTMMLADLENDYMTGSYYLQYLERYAYRVYGKGVKEMPLIELLNKWLKINDRTETQKTFTIPYIYLPDPEYKDGKLVIDSDKVNIQNSTGATYEEDGSVNFNDPNLRDVTGFITYTWMRSDGQNEPQQEMDDGSGNHDITIDYVVKNTKQIKYNLQLKFTPLKEGALTDFSLDKEKFITDSGDGKRDNFFGIDKTVGSTNYLEFTDKDASGDPLEKWTVDFNRTDYLQAMVSEEKTYEPHVMYDADAAGGGKWVLVDEESDNFKSEDAVNAYVDADIKTGQTQPNGVKGVTDKGVYDWDPDYKPFEKGVQIEKDIFTKYTDTPQNVNLLDAEGNRLTDENGNLTATTTPCSLTANTTYTKDVVNAALALELFVDGKYLKEGSPLKVANKTFTFEATRDYEDPYDPPLYGGDLIGADANSQAYRLTFKIDPTSLPKDPQEKTIYQVWATLTNVKVKVESEYQDIKEIGYTDLDALPIGTYKIKTSDVLGDNNSLKNNQFLIAQKDTAGLTDDLYFEYLKTDSTASNYKYDKFPESVHKVSGDAATDTNDGEYLILNGSTDNSQKNIAENDRKKVADTQTATFYFGTVESREVGAETLYNTKGESAKDYLKEHPNDKQLTGFKDDYAKDRLGIIMLSADENSLVVTKEVKNTENSTDEAREWTFKVTIKTDEKEWFSKHSNIEYTLYSRNAKGEWESGEIKTIAITTPTPDSNGIYTLEISIQLTHNQKAIFNDLPSGTWQVEEVKPTIGEVLYTPHNNQSGWGDSWEYHNSPATDVNTLTPLSQVDFVNEFPYALPSAGGDGINLTVYTGIVLILAGGIWLILLRRKAHSRDKPSEGGCP